MSGYSYVNLDEDNDPLLEGLKCVCCLSVLNNPVAHTCGEMFCMKCACDTFESDATSRKCPSCRSDLVFYHAPTYIHKHALGNLVIACDTCNEEMKGKEFTFHFNNGTCKQASLPRIGGTVNLPMFGASVVLAMDQSTGNGYFQSINKNKMVFRAPLEDMAPYEPLPATGNGITYFPSREATRAWAWNPPEDVTLPPPAITMLANAVRRRLELEHGMPGIAGVAYAVDRNSITTETATAALIEDRPLAVMIARAPRPRLTVNRPIHRQQQQQDNSPRAGPVNSPSDVE